MRILITGGAGFIGANVATRAVALGHDVLNVDCLTGAASLSSVWHLEDEPNYALEAVDLQNRAAMTRIMDAFQPDVIFHLAAETRVDADDLGPSDGIASTLDGTLTLLDMLRAHGGRACPLIWLDTAENKGASPVRAAHAARRALIPELSAAWSLDTRRIVCGPIYGPRQRPQSGLSALIIALLENAPPHPLIVANDDGWLHVDDLADALLQAGRLDACGDRHVFGTKGFSGRDVVRHVTRLVAMRGAKVPAGIHGWLMQQVAGAPSPHMDRALSEVPELEGWTPQIAPEVGLSSTVEWYAGNQVWWGPMIGQSAPVVFRSTRAA